MRKSMQTSRTGYRHRLLAGVSVLALLAATFVADDVQAGTDADRPPLWIEFGGQLERYSGAGDPFTPPFTLVTPRPAFETTSPIGFQKPTVYGYGGEGKISFQPEGSDWIFSASIRFARSHSGRHEHQQTVPTSPYRKAFEAKFSDVTAGNNEAHAIADFSAGRDVGLGMFGRDSTSVVGIGLRFAQFTGKAKAGIKADPDLYFPPGTLFHQLKYAHHHHTYSGYSNIERSFRGIGPSLSWNASAPLAGNTQDGEVTLDWGANAALLFGRQKMKGHHQTMGDYYSFIPIHFSASYIHTHYQHSANPSRSRRVTVPNLGGFAGLSLQWTNAKLSLGYRGDFFFGAIDGGIDARTSTTRGFYGPFASISVGLGN